MSADSTVRNAAEQLIAAQFESSATRIRRRLHSARLSSAFRVLECSWDILKILSDPTRLRLLALVMREELSVAELQEILGMGQSRISSQLALLRTVNLVTDRREGKNAFYSFPAISRPDARLDQGGDRVRHRTAGDGG